MPLLPRLFLLCFIASGGFLWALDNDDYQQSVDTFARAPLVQPYFRNAYGFALFPWVGKGGVGIGGAYGEGRVYRRNKYRGQSRMIQLSVGALLGGQAYSEIIFFKDKRSYDAFTRGSFAFDASASAVLLDSAMHARTGTTGRSSGTSVHGERTRQLRGGYINGMAVFTHVHGGLMYEAALEGQQFSYESDPRVSQP